MPIYTEHASEVNATEHASEARQCHKREHNGSRWCKDPKAQLAWSKGIVAMSFACNRGDVMQSKSFGCNRARCHAMELPHAPPRAASMGLQGKPVPIGILQSHLGIELSGGGKANPRSKWTCVCVDTTCDNKLHMLPREPCPQRTCRRALPRQHNAIYKSPKISNRSHHGRVYIHKAWNKRTEVLGAPLPAGRSHELACGQKRKLSAKVPDPSSMQARHAHSFGTAQNASSVQKSWLTKSYI